MRAIVIYATCEGQTEKIAQHVAKTLSESGVPTDTFDVTHNSADELCVDSYDAVVLGSSLHYAAHDPRVGLCIHENQEMLSEVPTAFFSVSLGIVSQHEKDRREAAWLADEFLREQQFEPSMRACFAGALRYSRYGWLKARLMRWIASKSGSQTEMDHDYEYTDWEAVERFSKDFAELVHRCRRPKTQHRRFQGPEGRNRECSTRNLTEPATESVQSS